MRNSNCGDHHPVALDRRKCKYEADKRAASKFVEILDASEVSYLRDADGVRAGLEIFDREATNIRHWQAWAVRMLEAHPQDESAARLCRDFALKGNHATDIRIHAMRRIQWQDAAILACRILGDREGEGDLENIGLAWFELGDAEKAIGFHEQALAFARQAKDRTGEGLTLGSLGNAFLGLGQPQKAIEHYGRRLSLARITGDQRSEGNAMGSLGNAWFVLGDHRKAHSYYKRALVVRQS